jgi:2-polyprenyl-3-methyl-5-hydroxy-6-metoxy-1,4-benzoquinol methylase
MLTVDYRRLGMSAGERVLDVGCGGGRHAYEALRLGARVVAVDAAHEEVAQVQGMLAALAAADPDGCGQAGVVQGDTLQLPFPDGAFDRVIAAEMLEHVTEDGAAMHELARLLRPGGILAVTVPAFGPEAVNWALSKEYHGVPGGHVRIYRRPVLLGRLVHAGLQPVATHRAHALHSPYWWLRCLVGVGREDHPAVRAYHRLLVWDIVRHPRVTRWVERALNPVLGKSLVVYAEKPA